MSFYPEKISERFYNAENSGNLSGANAGASNASFVCGSAVRFGLWIDPRSKEVLDVKYGTNGCGYLIAAAEVLCTRIKGTRLTELGGLESGRLLQIVEGELGRFPEGRKHCFDSVFGALADALTNFRTFQLGEFAADKALICTCFGVSEHSIEKIVRENPGVSVEDVGRACNAGTGCGSCRSLIGEIIDAAFDIFN